VDGVQGNVSIAVLEEDVDDDEIMDVVEILS
jgi:hypothetical protein